MATDKTPAEAAPMNSLAALTGGMGHKLEEIKGETVVVSLITFDTRQVHGIGPKGEQLDELEDKDVAFITCDGNVFYTFSDPLIKKLREVKDADLPAVAVFDIKDIAGGRRVWTIS
jgi:hypothetical protein